MDTMAAERPRARLNRHDDGKAAPRKARGDGGRHLQADWFLRARLKFRHLQLFLALDEHRNLQRAAVSLGLSQPAASRLLSELEDMLGVELFERRARGIAANWCGDVMIRHSRAILSALGRAGEELSALQVGRGGTVSVGAVAAPAVDLLVGAIDAVVRDYPRLQVGVQLDTSDVLAQRVLDGKLDFALGRIPRTIDSAPFDYEEIADEELCFLCRDGHPLVGRNDVALADMIDCTWVLQPRGTLLRRQVETLFRSQGLAMPRRIVDSASVLMTVATIRKTDAVTMVARSVGDLFAMPGGCAILPYGPPLRVEPYGLFRLHDRPLSPGADALLRAVRAAAWPDRPA